MTSQPTYTSINHNADKSLVICAACEHMQYEQPHPLDKGGKFAWRCRSCGKINENDKIHLLQNTAFFGSKRGLGM